MANTRAFAHALRPPAPASLWSTDAARGLRGSFRVHFLVAGLLRGLAWLPTVVLFDALVRYTFGYRTLLGRARVWNRWYAWRLFTCDLPAG